jgi:hypothetical protein
VAKARELAREAVRLTGGRDPGLVKLLAALEAGDAAPKTPVPQR